MANILDRACCMLHINIHIYTFILPILPPTGFSSILNLQYMTSLGSWMSVSFVVAMAWALASVIAITIACRLSRRINKGIHTCI
jgi:hypothetical protein